ncbi:hypothetical protein ACWIDS_16085 [Dietzia maris]
MSIPHERPAVTNPGPQYQPQQPGQPYPPQEQPKKKRGGCMKWGAIIIGVLVALFVITGLAGGFDESEEATGDQSTTTSAEAPPSSADQATSTSREEAASSPVAAPAARGQDPRCTPADGPMLALLEAGLEDPSLTLTNGTMIVSGKDTWVGATTLDGDGEMESRSDVWLFRNSVPFTVTGGARSATPAYAPASGIGASAGDEAAQAVDGCVVEQTR